MTNLLKATFRLSGVGLAAGALMAAPAVRPGMLNYVEGQVAVDGRSMGSQAIGKTEVEPGQVLTTQQGKAEMLLTPGVFFRLSEHSSARMVSPSLTDARVELLQGEALVEAQDVQKENRIDVIDHGVGTLLEKKGIYRFDADHPMVAVFEGKAKVLTSDDKGVELGKGRELALNSEAGLKPRKFDRAQVDSLYQWSKLRSEYDARANEASARMIMIENPGWYYGTGWYWNPWYSSWAFVPGAGFGYSPFGFGFYSPGYWAYGRPFYGYRRAPVLVRPGRVGVGSAARLGRGARM